MTLKLSRPKFKKTTKWLNKRGEDFSFIVPILREFGSKGVSALRAATPKDSGEAAAAWSYIITEKGGVYKLYFVNSVMAGNVPLVVILQYGHGTGTGGWVPGRDFINPALDPIFEGLKLAIAKEVVRQ